MAKTIEIKPATGKLGVLIPGMGAVATTFVAGVYAVQKGLGKPIGSLTQMGTIRLGQLTDKRIPFIKDFVPLTDLNDLVFGGWDIFPYDMYEAAIKVGVLEKEILNGIRSELKNVKPRPAVFDQNYVKRLNGTHVKKGKTKTDFADQLRKDIQDFFSIVPEIFIIRAFPNLPILDQLSKPLGPRFAYRSMHFEPADFVSITMTILEKNGIQVSYRNLSHLDQQSKKGTPTKCCCCCSSFMARKKGISAPRYPRVMTGKASHGRNQPAPIWLKSL